MKKNHGRFNIICLMKSVFMELLMIIETERLLITTFSPDMAESVYRNSLDDDNRRFVPDEVFETVEAAENIITAITSFYGKSEMPQIYAVLLREGNQHIGHVQAVPIKSGWEVGYHIGKDFTKMGYATEAVKAFLPEIMRQLDITEIHGICHADNIASKKVLENCGFTLVRQEKSLIKRICSRFTLFSGQHRVSYIFEIK